REIGPADAAAGEPKPVERLRRGHLVDEVQVDEEQRRRFRLVAHDVRVPDALEHRLPHEVPIVADATRGGRGSSNPARYISGAGSPALIDQAPLPLPQEEGA